MNLRIKTFLEGTKLSIKILHQAEYLRKYGFVFRASNGFTLKIFLNPEIQFDCLYLRGRDEQYDLITSEFRFSYPENAQNWIKDLKFALAEYFSQNP